MGRPAPLVALLGAYQLTNWQAGAEQLQVTDDQVRAGLHWQGFQVLGGPLQHSQPGHIPVLLETKQDDSALEEALGYLTRDLHSARNIRVSWQASGAKVSPWLDEVDRRLFTDMLSRVRVVQVVLDDHPGPKLGINWTGGGGL